ncbi:Exodeoxyribonuclease 1 [Yarrowia sp. C11]|nr:Exodeoxyribonuclease 1 [Yarrowia sp. C11]
MGVSGLLPLLKPIQNTTHISEFKGQRLAVDGFAWLHKAAFGSAEELALNKPTDRPQQWVMRKIEFLKRCGVDVLLVFDGGALPSKRGTDEKRHALREQAQKEALALLSRGRRTEALNLFQKATRITQEMVHQLTEMLKAQRVPFVVAPYEADAQLVYLEKAGYVTGIISEDSDLMVYGAQMLVTKLDPTGTCVTVDGARISSCTELELGSEVSLEYLRYLAILAGCDYCDGVPNVGLKRAARYIRRWQTPEAIIKALRMDGYNSSSDFLEKFHAANYTFLYQRVYCPEARRLVHLSEPEDELDEKVDFHIGAELPHGLSRAIATGLVHPRTHKTFPVNKTAKPTNLRGFFAPKNEYTADVKRLPEQQRRKKPVVVAKAPDLAIRTASAENMRSPTQTKKTTVLTSSPFFTIPSSPDQPEKENRPFNFNTMLSSEPDRSDDDIEESSIVFGTPNKENSFPQTPVSSSKRKPTLFEEFGYNGPTPKRRVVTPTGSSRITPKSSITPSSTPKPRPKKNAISPLTVKRVPGTSQSSLMRFAYKAN